MEHEHFIVEIEGEEISDVYSDIISLEVELDDELTGMFRIQIALLQESDGTWNYLDDERFTVWKKTIISAGFESGTEELLAGYITHIKPHFDPDITQCMLEIWGMDSSVEMDQEEKLKDWPNKKDSDIASDIFNLYGMTPVVEDTAIVHDEAISTIIQRETDIQFLKRLALRNGYECYVDGENGYFRKPQINTAPQPVLAMFFGDETNLNRITLEMNALEPSNVAMSQIDRVAKTILDVSTTSSQQKILGKKDAAGLLASGINAGQMYVGMNVATGTPEMTALCQGMFHQAEWFLTGEGEIAGNQYGHALTPRGTVTIKGVGETYSGVYYVAHVTHSFTSIGYTQSFHVKRNAIMPMGSEDFSTSAV
jgi:phage protein D